ncbi:MerR family transcriptional regulator [Zafaria sp. Z1313]|uniref:MerR family transcriptional regulator n=1 Tax=unclassified Zafaria TaxID=2828765 RepID=UPI002E784515|nr:MerR family transcriptional regulator [Zafaria sp. J156]MEE1621517.1 MerR family transcriptional regulator [Zafaria sp. J156]
MMKLSELAAHTGASTASLKFYLREGLLPPGEAVHATLADYGQRHVDRVEMIRALRSVAGLSIGALRGVVERIDVGDPLELLGYVQAAVLGLDQDAVDAPASDPAADALEARHGWGGPGGAAHAALRAQLALMRSLGAEPVPGRLDVYARAVQQIAEADLATSLRTAGERGLEQMVIEAATAMHLQNGLLVRMLAVAQASQAGRRFGAEQ